MEFRTIVPCEKLQHQISHRDKILLLGSCFAENIGHLLVAHKFNVKINPTGILYNPVSIADALQMMSDRYQYTVNDIFRDGNLWHSFRHHSRFSHTDPELCIDGINRELKAGAEQLHRASWLLVTFGTAYVYSLRETGKVVANCHKLPASLFDRRRVGVDEMNRGWIPLIERLSDSNPELRIMFTVSPIRHLRDGAHENQLSKSVLLLFVDELCRMYPDRCIYFPSYEIVLDELRDYRYYADDMLHPSPLAVRYLWERFSEAFFSAETKQVITAIEDITKDLSHKPFHPESEAYQRFLGQIVLKIERLNGKYPYLDFQKETELCHIRLNP